MRMKIHYLLILGLFVLNVSWAQEKKFMVHTVAFYNVENLFDTIRDPKIFDEEWTPKGAQAWVGTKYNKKIKNLAEVISQIGTDENKNMPTILGVAEVENRAVLEDLVKAPQLLAGDYGIVHYDSPDKRGIDVGLIYQKKHFTPTHTANIPLYIYAPNEKSKEEGTKNKRVYTRDQLLVTGLLDGEEINFIVNHWPSRSGGEKKSSPFREAAAALNKKIIDSLYVINPNAKIITMGDLNDGPYNKSIKEVLGAKGKKELVDKKGLFNPMEQMSKDGIGTLAYRDAWDIFDQIILSEPLLGSDYSSFTYWKARVYKKPFMVQKTGAFTGYPLRNSNGEVGYSDHFPVYVYLIKQVN